MRARTVRRCRRGFNTGRREHADALVRTATSACAVRVSVRDTRDWRWEGVSKVVHGRAMRFCLRGHYVYFLWPFGARVDGTTDSPWGVEEDPKP